MATDTRRTGPQFTHGKLLEAATLLRLPVDLLADRLGLTPDVATTSVSLDQLPMPSYDMREGLLSQSHRNGYLGYLDQGQSHSFQGSLHNSSMLIARLPMGPSSLGSRTSQSVSPSFAKDLTRTILWDPATTPSVGVSAEDVFQKHEFPSTCTVDRPSGNYLAIPDHRAGTPSSPVSLGAATDASSYVASSLSSQPTTSTTTSNSSLKVEETSPTNNDDSDGTHDEFAVTKAETEAAIVNVHSLGPCSKVWVLPPRIQRRRKPRPDGASPAKRKRDSSDVAKNGPKRRGAYTDQAKKRSTALTRVLKSCIRCRMNRGRCNPDPDNLHGPCLTCKRMTGPTLCKMPCYRYIITDALLYREQKAPFQVYSKRWQSMDIVDIPCSGWASDETRTIVVSPIHAYAPFQFRVREFIPVDGDLLEEQWMTTTGLQKILLPRYAVADMQEAARDLKTFVETNVWNFINASVQKLDPLFWETYFMAFRHIGNAHTPEERALLTNTFRLWVTCRLISNPVHICSEEKLGGHPIYSPDSLHDGKVPMPVIMTAQFECINYTNFLRPWSKTVLKQLNELVLAKKREYWLTIYFAMFILLHSCAMLTRRDEETARQYDMKDQYANPETIRGHQSGMQTMLAHFHFINKGVAPFALAHTSVGRQELSKAAALDDDEVKFVWKTSTMIQDHDRAARIWDTRERGQVGDDLYWVSMLFDSDWKPMSQD